MGIYYSVKEIMEKFGLTREALKHYEKKGLISASRMENNYRVYDEIDIQKIKRILELQSMGFTMDEIGLIETIKDNDLQGVMHEKIEKLQEKADEINRKVIHIEAYLYDSLHSLDFTDEYGVCENVRLCFDCERIHKRHIRTFFVRDVETFERKGDSFVNIKGNQMSVIWYGADEQEKSCEGCTAQGKMFFAKAYGGVFVDDETESVEEHISDVYKKAREKGYELQDTIYAVKYVKAIDNKHYMSYRIIVPIK